jgi:GH15 family glucan-1,4-alpha-glucosidase
MDDRFTRERSPTVLSLLERLTQRAIAVAGTPDAGIWEYRTEWQPQTFSTLMCWAAADRMATIASRHAPAREGEYRTAAERIRETLMQQAWSEDLGGFAGTHGGKELDASLLQMAVLRMFSADDRRLVGTIDAIWRGLSHNGWLFRYKLDDGFGRPAVAFIICTFWLIEALASTGRRAEAREIMDRVQAAMSPLGLLSEDYETTTLRLWGNFPQAYSHVGLIHAAFAASPSWSQVL